MENVQEILTSAGVSDTPWGKRIHSAWVRGEFSTSNNRKAGSWGHCPCAHLPSAIPAQRDGHSVGRPVDKVLHSLGVDFEYHVWANEFTEAAKTLVAIHARADEVLAHVPTVNKKPVGRPRKSIALSP